MREATEREGRGGAEAGAIATVNLVSSRTRETDAERAAEALVRDLGREVPKLFFFFAPRDLDHLALNRALRARLPRTRLLGASSGRQLDGDGQHEGAIVGAALSGDLEVGLGVARRLAADPVGGGTTAMLTACADLGVAPRDLSKRHVGIVVPDGYAERREELLLGMTEPNPGIVLVGGGASDERDIDPSAIVHVDGDVMGDAALVALVQTDAVWAAMRSHGYRPTGRRVTITRVDASCRRAIEIDGLPAAARYAELLDVPVEELEFGNRRGFAQNPTGTRVGREHFIRAPWKPLADGSILFANLIEEGMELDLLEAEDDLGETTRRFLTEEVPARVGDPTAALYFRCAGCRIFTDARQETAAFSAALGAAPWGAGMEAFFEIYRGFSLNSTLSALVFGRGA